jgi:DNA-binding NarL/FixJ family response regulator
VLSGQAPTGAGAKLPKGKPRVVKARGIETTFDAAADRNADARVIVVDVDEFGVAFVRDLHTVFPAAKIVALSSSPRTMARALKAGAVIALPRSTPPATLAKVIQKLLSPPKKAAKPKKPHRTQGPPAKN